MSSRVRARFDLCATGLAFPESPVVIGKDAVAFVEIAAGRLSAWRGEDVETLAEVGGAPAALAVLPPDDERGLFVFTQSGTPLQPSRRSARQPALEALAADGDVVQLVTAIAGVALAAPNDVCVDGDGTIWFTDSGEEWRPESPAALGRICALDRAQTTRAISVGSTFPNGIASKDGQIIVAESYTRRIARLNGERFEPISHLPEGHVPDGLAIASDWTIAVASPTAGGVDVVNPDGTLDFLPIPGSSPTNCAIDDGGVLYVTDAGLVGRLWRLSGYFAPAVSPPEADRGARGSP